MKYVRINGIVATFDEKDGWRCPEQMIERHLRASCTPTEGTDNADTIAVQNALTEYGPTAAAFDPVAERAAEEKAERERIDGILAKEREAKPAPTPAPQTEFAEEFIPSEPPPATIVRTRSKSSVTLD